MEWKWSSQSSRLPPLLSCLAQPMVYPYPWQPEGRASYEIKATGGRETGHIYFDVFTSHERRWQPPNVSTHDALGQLPASVHFTSPSLSPAFVTFQKASKVPKREYIRLIPVPSDSSLMSGFVVFYSFEIWKLPVFLKICLWPSITECPETVVPGPTKVLWDGYLDRR